MLTIVYIAQSIRCIGSLVSFTSNAYDLRSMTRGHFNSLGKLLDFISTLFFFLATALATTAANAAEKKEHNE